ncbi:MAG: sialidase-1 [Mariniblastus sp.]|jgi:sialidase-1
MSLNSFNVLSLFCLLSLTAQTLAAESGLATDSLTRVNPRPNVLFIAVDDLRPELNCFGATHIKSPNIDRLAASGMRFGHAYCQQAVCNPSRTSLMTGMRPDSIGVTGNHSHFRTIHPNVVTLPQHFKNNGYFAQAIGKIYHGVFPDGSSNTKWDTMGDPESWSVPATRFGPRYYYTETGIAAAKTTFQKVYQPKNPGPDDWTQKLVFGPATESPDVVDDTLYDGKVADAAIIALQGFKQNPAQPFFLAVGFIKPHSPYIAPKKYFDLYENVDIASDQDLPVGAPRFAGHSSGELRRYTDQPSQGPIPHKNQARVRQAYFACVSYIDAQIGRVLAELERLELEENTIVSLFGDHGYHLGEQGLWGKTTNFELDTLVPLIVRVPGMQHEGVLSDSLIELVDLFPTLTELAGLPPREQLEGDSFVSVLNDPTATTKDAALSQYPRRGGLMGYSMRTANRRMTQWIDVNTGRAESTELYEYKKGQTRETENLAGDPKLSASIELASKKLFAKFGLSPAISTNNNKASRNPSAAETSFETSAPGEFKSLKTGLGTWTVSAGTGKVDHKHAKTGKQCLQLPGGVESVIELSIDDSIKTDGQLNFWAERWTSRGPFRFRVEKKSLGNWTEIYNGDKKVRVGRAFLSNVVIPLNDLEITDLRLSVTSPPNTGVLIDDVLIAAAEPQTVTQVEVVPLALPALVGTEASPILKLRVDVEGILNPLSLTHIMGTLEGTTDRQDLSSIKVYFSGNASDFAATQRFGESISPRAKLEFDGSQRLSVGANFFWICGKLNKDADIDHRVGATCTEVTFSNGKTVQLKRPPSIQRMGVAVRSGGADGVHTYRIPGMATTNQGSLIGVYDVRHDGGGDLPGNIDVGMSRSSDGGQTWDPMKIIMDMGSDKQWRGDGIGDPSVMVDRTTGTIWVAATWSHGNRSWVGSGPGLAPEETGQWMMAKSDDDGLSWSTPINITHQVKKPEWSFLLQGPGKGITLANGTLVFPAQYQDPPHPTDKKANRLPHSTFIYSHDHGITWQTATGAWNDTTEAQVVELANGDLMINCRNNRASKRAIMTTTDMGQTWKQHPTHIKDLIEPGSCMASLINVGRELKWRNLESEHDNQFLLFSNPDSLGGRNHMTIKASLNSGDSWPANHQLLVDEQGGRGYSCLSMIDSETVGILYEGSQADMTYQRIKIADILSPPQDQKIKNPAFSRSPPSPNNPVDPRKATQAKTSGALSVARVFGDHMVLQADMPIRVWGISTPNSEVEVSLGHAQQTILADPIGNWMVELPPRSRTARPQTLAVKSEGLEVNLNDILIGEVWFCAGQSNMEWPLAKSSDAKRAMGKSNDSQLRLLNFTGAARGGSGVYDESQFKRMNPEQFSQGTWAVSNPSTVKDFSAVGYYFAEHCRRELECPIGIINVSIGGTPIEAWVSKAALKSSSTLDSMIDGDWLENPVLDDWCKTRARFNLQHGLSGHVSIPGDENGPNHSFKPGFMYEAAVRPFQPMSIKGVLWYQGESNAENRRRIQQYNQAFPLLVSSWRAGFRNADLPVAFVQLPAMGRAHWPVFREYQRRSLANLKNAGMAVTIDKGHPTNVHPTAKSAVGQRLAHWALVSQYDQQGPAMGPLFQKQQAIGNHLVLEFSEVGNGMETSNGRAPNNFELSGADGVFHAAVAKVFDGNKVSLMSAQVNQPVQARYAWAPFPTPLPNLVNSIGIPASPFSTGDEF